MPYTELYFKMRTIVLFILLGLLGLIVIIYMFAILISCIKGVFDKYMNNKIDNTENVDNK